MFDASKLITLTTFYRDDFTDADRFSLRRELDLYYETVIHDTDFMKLTGIAELAMLMVTRKKHSISFPLIYKLLKLSLLLPVATATVERCFPAMKLIKTNLRNRMGENYMNDALICDAYGSHINWVSWDHISKPKDEGGLDFRDLKAFNLALLTNQVGPYHEDFYVRTPYGSLDNSSRVSDFIDNGYWDMSKLNATRILAITHVY
ncbi:zinc finger MYM-type protein 1-like protein [Tanacetum coccineum]